MAAKADALIRKVAGSPDGVRNGVTYWALKRAVEEGHPTSVLDAIGAAAEAAGLPSREVATIMRSALRELVSA
jgi:hypothetical protein